MTLQLYYGEHPVREVRAVYDDISVRVYQTFSNNIALELLAHQKLVPPFSFMRNLTWIKPSFLWTMKRTHWGEYSEIAINGSHGVGRGESTVLSITVNRIWFDTVLRTSAVINREHFRHMSLPDWRRRCDEALSFVQWDPEKDLGGRCRPYRAIQIGLKPKALAQYSEAILRIEPMTATIRNVSEAKGEQAKIAQLPDEHVYPTDEIMRVNLIMQTSE
ncbi:MAG: DUF4291 family protein [Bacteroidota bacterium]|jgi:hypothetical protein